MNDNDRRLLRRWPGEVLTLDTTRLPMAETQRIVLGHLGLSEIPADTVMPALEPFTGIYDPRLRMRKPAP